MYSVYVDHHSKEQDYLREVLPKPYSRSGQRKAIRPNKRSLRSAQPLLHLDASVRGVNVHCSPAPTSAIGLGINVKLQNETHKHLKDNPLETS